MTTSEFLSDLRHKGIRLWAEGDKLRFSAPKGALTEEIRAELVERKAELLSFLNQITTASPLNLSSIRAISRDGELPLSFAEEGLWLLDQLSPGMTAWNMQSSVRLRGPLNVSALERSLNTIFQRHDVLRTSFRVVKETPARIVVPTLTVNLPVIDLNQCAELETESGRIASEAAQLPFNLSEGPLLRVSLFKLGETEHIFLLTKHHIITDAWSSRLFLRELFSLYEAYSAGRPSPLSDLPIQYSDFAVWQRQLKQGEMERHLSYWKNRLQQEVTVSELPCDYPRPTVQSFRGARQEIQLSESVSHALRALSKQERTTLFMTLLAAFKILLHRYTGETEIVLGSTIAGRNRPEFEKLIGFFINVLVLRTDLSGQPSFRDLLRRVREVCLEAYEHQDLPFEKLVEVLKPKRDPGRNPFFQVLFNMTNLPPIQREVAGLTIETLSRAEDRARFDLTLYALETNERIKILAAYSTDLFTPVRMAEMLEQYKHLLAQIVENPDEKIDRYSLVTPSARAVLPDPTAHLDDTWHGAVHEFFRRQARKHPDKIAVEDWQEVWSFREMDLRSNQLARYLLASGIGRENIVAIYGHRSAALVWALMGILKAGAAFCILDPAYPAQRLKDYLDLVKPKGWIQIKAAGEPVGEMEEVLGGVSFCCRITLPGLATAKAGGFLSEYSQDDPGVKTSADDLAYVIFTSGSTGKPKGVLGRHGPLTHFLPWLKETFGFSENDRFSLLSGLTTNKLQREVFTALSLGATLCIPDPDEIGSFGRLDQWMREKEISIVHLTPAMGQLLEDTSRQEIPSVRRVVFGGDLLRMSDVDRARRLMPQAEVVNFYNSSETQRGGSYIVFSDQRLDHAKETPPLGRGVKDVQLLVLNRTGYLAGVGEIGEICVRSSHMARGYLGDEELTKERFITNPFTRIEGDRVYRTGEQGRYLPNGDVEFVARAENRVSIRGFRVELGEIEATLLQHRDVREAVVILRADSPRGDELIAYVVLKPDGRATASELRGSLGSRLPRYMLPAAYVFLNALPLTPSGKLDRGALPAPALSDPASQPSFVAARNWTERAVMTIWSDLFGNKQIGIHDNFFDLGGQSLLAVRLLAQINRDLRVDLPLRILFDLPTVAQLASRIETILARSCQESEGLDAYASTIELQRGEGCRRIFCFPSAGGTAAEFFSFSRMARYFGPDCSFYALRVRGLDGVLPPSTHVEGMASDHVREIRKIQPGGPYLLVGECLGGIVAYETARQLVALGEDIDLLGLLDTYAWSNLQYLWRRWRSLVEQRASGLLWLLRYLDLRLRYHLREIHRLRLLEALGYVLSAAFSTAVKIASIFAHRFRDHPPSLPGFEPDNGARPGYGVSGHVERVQNSFKTALQRYRLRPYAGKVSVLVNERSYANNPTLGWCRWAHDGVDAYKLPGNHDTCVPENIPLVAEILQGCIKKAEASRHRAETH